MGSLATVIDDVIGFHARLCRHGDGLPAAHGLVDPGMMLHIPAEFPWQPVCARGAGALREYRDALDVISDRTFEMTTAGHTADERVVAIRCHESATRNQVRMDWSSLWIYALAAGRVTEITVVHAVPGDQMADFWCS